MIKNCQLNQSLIENKLKIKTYIKYNNITFFINYNNTLNCIIEKSMKYIWKTKLFQLNDNHYLYNIIDWNEFFKLQINKKECLFFEKNKLKIYDFNELSKNIINIIKFNNYYILKLNNKDKIAIYNLNNKENKTEIKNEIKDFDIFGNILKIILNNNIIKLYHRYNRKIIKVPYNINILFFTKIIEPSIYRVEDIGDFLKITFNFLFNRVFIDKYSLKILKVDINNKLSIKKIFKIKSNIIIIQTLKNICLYNKIDNKLINLLNISNNELLDKLIILKNYFILNVSKHNSIKKEYNTHCFENKTWKKLKISENKIKEELGENILTLNNNSNNIKNIIKIKNYFCVNTNFNSIFIIDNSEYLHYSLKLANRLSFIKQTPFNNNKINNIRIIGEYYEIKTNSRENNYYSIKTLKLAKLENILKRTINLLN